MTMMNDVIYPHCRSIIEKGLVLHGFVVLDGDESEFSIQHKNSRKVMRVRLADLQTAEVYHEKLQRLLRLYAETTDTN